MCIVFIPSTLLQLCRADADSMDGRRIGCGGALHKMCSRTVQAGKVSSGEGLVTLVCVCKLCGVMVDRQRRRLRSAVVGYYRPTVGGSSDSRVVLS